MIGLNELIALNERAAKGQLERRDNFNRECSFAKSRGGFVVHSGVHRSTAYIHPDICADAFHAAGYWLYQEPAARDAFITQIVGGVPLDAAEERAFRAARPEWSVKIDGGTGRNVGGRAITAFRPSGRLKQSTAAFTWRHLHHRTA